MGRADGLEEGEEVQVQKRKKGEKKEEGRPLALNTSQRYLLSLRGRPLALRSRWSKLPISLA